MWVEHILSKALVFWISLCYNESAFDAIALGVMKDVMCEVYIISCKAILLLMWGTKIDGRACLWVKNFPARVCSGREQRGQAVAMNYTSNRRVFVVWTAELNSGHWLAWQEGIKATKLPQTYFLLHCLSIFHEIFC